MNAKIAATAREKFAASLSGKIALKHPAREKALALFAAAQSGTVTPEAVQAFFAAMPKHPALADAPDVQLHEVVCYGR